MGGGQLQDGPLKEAIMAEFGSLEALQALPGAPSAYTHFVASSPILSSARVLRGGVQA
jgi:hypothetical protein